MADLFADQHERPPKERIANLIFRVLVLAEMARNPAFAANVEEICRRDDLFFYDAFCWVYEPRPRKDADGNELPKEIPFIAWTHQEPALIELEEHLGFRDVGIKKARGEGASFMAALKATKDWSLKDGAKINFVSKDEDAADRKNDSDSLMWKVDFAVERLPQCFVGRPKFDYTRNYGDHVLYNVRRGSAITAYAATADVGSGGRCDWFLMDELAKFPRPQDEDAMASTQYITDSRLIVSTPKGAAGAYYDVMHEPSDMVVIVLDWKDNPTRNRGLYLFKDGRPEAIDPVNNPLPPEYDPPNRQVQDRMERLRRRGFQIEGKVRSPWYDLQCDRPKATPEFIARELDMDFGGSEARIMTHRFFTVAEGTVRHPDVRGDFVVDFDKGTCRFVPAENGPASLWMPLDVTDRPRPGRYVLGADVATGGAERGSNSTLEGIDQVRREQVLEYVTTFLEPSEFGALAVAVARWLYNAHLAWEENGPGAAFGRAVVLTHRYVDVFQEVRLKRGTRERVSKPGWWANDAKKWSLFSEVSIAAQREELIIRSADSLKEFGQYIRRDGKVTHVSAGNDPSHGDRAIGLGVCWQACLARPVPTEPEQESPGPPPVGSIAHRLHIEQQIAKQQAESRVWDERSTASLHGGEGDLDELFRRRELLGV